MTDYLAKILAHIFEQQKFVEAKCAVLSTVCGAASLTLITAYAIRSSSTDPGLSKFYLIPMVSFLLALLTSVVALFPVTTVMHKNSAGTGATGSLIYFGEIRKLNVETYLSRLGRSFSSSLNVKDIDRDYADQIIKNSVITYRKVTAFRLGSILMILSILLVIAIHAAEAGINWLK
jgi:hypothetical protein